MRLLPKIFGKICLWTKKAARKVLVSKFLRWKVRNRSRDSSSFANLYPKLICVEKMLSAFDCRVFVKQFSSFLELHLELKGTLLGAKTC